MVFIREEGEHHPLSLILPHLYLGAEADVTQDCLSSQGISYVLSVSRCCPQPAFLPQKQYLRIPIDDSLRDELLPWIPEALQFIDGAMSAGCSVLIHCAAGISRSPSLAVAYVMYRLGLGLDEAYRFVKERRPSISPNFNFLGQLQSFQRTLSHMHSRDNPNPELITTPARRLNTSSVDSASTCSLSHNEIAHVGLPTESINNSGGCSEEAKTTANYGRSTNLENMFQFNKYSDCTDGRGEASPSQNRQMSTGFTLTLSNKFKTLSLAQTPADIQSPAAIQKQDDSANDNNESGPLRRPSHLQLSGKHNSYLDKRKSLKLSLTPLGSDSQELSRKELETTCGSSNSFNNPTQDHVDCSTTKLNQVTNASSNPKRQSKTIPQSGSPAPVRLAQGEKHRSYNKKRQSRENPSNPKTPNKKEDFQNAFPVANESSLVAKIKQSGRSLALSKCGTKTLHPCSSSQQKHIAEEAHCSVAVEAVESVDIEQIPLSPVSMTVNKLLCWGEKMLLRALLGPRIRIGQAALPYRC